MKKETLYAIIIILVATLLFSSCEKIDQYIDDETDETPLQVYLVYFDFYQMEAINKYNIEVEYSTKYNRRIEITEFEFEEIETMYDRITSEMMAGKGPDIIFFTSISAYYMDINKMTEQDALADLDILIEKSDTFTFDDYNKAALDAGIINGKRVMMPMSYKVNYIFSTQENMDYIDMPIPDYLTYDKLFEIIEKCHSETTSTAIGYPPALLIYNMISKDGIDEEGLKYLEKCMKLAAEDDIRYEATGYTGGMLEDLCKYICSGQILMNHSGNVGGSNEFDVLSNLYNIVENLYNKEIVIMNEPTVHGDSSYAYIDIGCAINKKSVHKNEAFEFVEYMLGEQCQYGYTVKTQSTPVNKASYEKAKEDFLNDKFAAFYNADRFEYALTPLPDDLKEKYIRIIESVSEYKYQGTERYISKHVINDSIQDYNDKKIDFSMMIEEINRKIKLYYSE